MLDRISPAHFSQHYSVYKCLVCTKVLNSQAVVAKHMSQTDCGPEFNTDSLSQFDDNNNIQATDSESGSKALCTTTLELENDGSGLDEPDSYNYEDSFYNFDLRSDNRPGINNGNSSILNELGSRVYVEYYSEAGKSFGCRDNTFVKL